jgi:5-methylcytosine-specific restriction endonuclease McrA
MIRKERYEPQKILEMVRGSTSRKIILDGDLTLIGSKSLLMYKKKGTSCIRCGRDGSYFSKERKEQDDHFHLTLYINENGKEILMTKDHILPKDLGGSNEVSNLQPMCFSCNEKKTNRNTWVNLETRQKLYGKQSIRLPSAEERRKEHEISLEKRKKYNRDKRMSPLSCKMKRIV